MSAIVRPWPPDSARVVVTREQLMKMSFTHTDNVQVCGTAAADPVWSEAESYLYEELQREKVEAEMDDKGPAPASNGQPALALVYEAVPEKREKFAGSLARNMHRTLEDERLAQAVSILNTFRHLSDLVCSVLDEHSLECLVRREAITRQEASALKLIARRIAEKVEDTDFRARDCERD